MIAQLIALGFRKGSKEMYYLTDLNNGLLICQCVAVESEVYIDSKSIDCIRLMFEWSNDGSLQNLEIRKAFTSFQPIVDCIEDFKKFHKEYL